MVVACIALVGAWGGPAFAAAFITGADVRNRTLTGRDIKSRSVEARVLKSNTVTGRVVKNLSGRDISKDSLDGWNIFEGGLGEVPRAASAGSADRATSAERVGTTAPLRTIATLTPGDEQQVVDSHGLRIRVRCLSPGQVEVLASVETAGALIRTTAIRGSQAASYAEDDDFRPGETFNLLSSGRPNAAGNLTYATQSGALVSLHYFADDGTTALTPTGGCIFGAQGTSSTA